MSGRRIECREEAGGFRLVDESGREYATFSRGSNAIDVNPMSLNVAKDCLFSLGAELLRIDERCPATCQDCERNEAQDDGDLCPKHYKEACKLADALGAEGYAKPKYTARGTLMVALEKEKPGANLHHAADRILKALGEAGYKISHPSEVVDPQTLVLRPLEEFIPELLELARGEDHDAEDCPQDDTCRCANIAKLNAELKAIQRMRAKS